MEISQIISENLNRLRNERNLSLGQLSDLSGISKVMLSKIEKGTTNPTINTLWKIAKGLKIPYTSLLEEQKPNTHVIKKSETSMQSDQGNHYRIYCYYNNTPTRNFELFQVELDAGCSYTSIGHSDRTQEYIMVLEGELHLEINNQVFILQPDDTICFVASAKHKYTSSGSKTLKATIINYYPT